MRENLSRNNSSKIIGDSGKNFSARIAICIISQNRKWEKGMLPFIFMMGIGNLFAIFGQSEKYRRGRELSIASIRE